MKRLFYRKTNDEYISMIIADSGIVYLYVNVNTRYLTRVEIDLTNIIDMQDPDSTCNQLKLEFEYSEYNNLDPIEIPDYVTKNSTITILNRKYNYHVSNQSLLYAKK